MCIRDSLVRTLSPLNGRSSVVVNATLLYCGNLTQTVSKWATQPLVGGLKTSKIQGKWPLFQKLSIWQVICRIYSLGVEKVEVLVAKKKRKQLFCKQCCREDTHARVQCPVLLKAFLFVITLGLAWFFWPRRCVCCGTVRIGAASLVRSTPWQWILGLSAEVICQQRLVVTTLVPRLSSDVRVCLAP